MNEEELKKEITLLKEELRTADDYYIKAVSDYNKLDDETRIKIEHLESQLEAIQEDGTEEHNNAVELRSKLVQSRIETDEWKKVARKLYSVSLHLKAIANSRNNIVVVGPGLYSEAVDSIKEYERLENL